MKKLQSLDQFREFIDTGFEIEFTLNGKGCLIEPDQDAEEFSPRRELASTEQNNLDYIKKFKDTNAVLEFKIEGKTIKDQWRNISNIEY
ncbi:hypothetical protein [uncultured Lactobacillus sp.]|uniref:hypothetical protein n=1 Tax=uncultured Lactobacillus sp. TaxID=153152 RepID=UPI00260D5023|nr:hypothetical protein [uncultured Lactobacillus sp.]